MARCVLHTFCVLFLPALHHGRSPPVVRREVGSPWIASEITSSGQIVADRHWTALDDLSALEENSIAVGPVTLGNAAASDDTPHELQETRLVRVPVGHVVALEDVSGGYMLRMSPSGEMGVEHITDGFESLADPSPVRFEVVRFGRNSLGLRNTACNCYLEVTSAMPDDDGSYGVAEGVSRTSSIDLLSEHEFAAFTVVDAGQGTVAFFGSRAQRFLRMDASGADAGAVEQLSVLTDAPGSGKRFLVRDLGELPGIDVSATIHGMDFPRVVNDSVKYGTLVNAIRSVLAVGDADGIYPEDVRVVLSPAGPDVRILADMRVTEGGNLANIISELTAAHLGQDVADAIGNAEGMADLFGDKTLGVGIESVHHPSLGQTLEAPEALNETVAIGITHHRAGSAIGITHHRAGRTWCAWNEWSACSVTCGPGTHSRTSTTPGNSCPPESVSCNVATCQIVIAMPTTAGCYVRHPSGCPGVVSGYSASTQWEKDAWGEEHGGAAMSGPACEERRKADYDALCHVTDTEMSFVSADGTKHDADPSGRSVSFIGYAPSGAVGSDDMHLMQMKDPGTYIDGQCVQAYGGLFTGTITAAFDTDFTAHSIQGLPSEPDWSCQMPNSTVALAATNASQCSGAIVKCTDMNMCVSAATGGWARAVQKTQAWPAAGSEFVSCAAAATPAASSQTRDAASQTAQETQSTGVDKVTAAHLIGQATGQVAAADNVSPSAAGGMAATAAAQVGATPEQSIQAADQAATDVASSGQGDASCLHIICVINTADLQGGHPPLKAAAIPGQLASQPASRSTSQPASHPASLVEMPDTGTSGIPQNSLGVDLFDAGVVP